LDQVARALLREFGAKDSLRDSQAMSEIDHNRHELVRRQSRSKVRRSQEIPEKLTPIATLLPIRFNEAFPDGFTSKSSDLEFSTKHNPIMVRYQVRKGIPKFLHALLRGRLVLQQRPEEIQAARLFLTDYSGKQFFFSVKVGVKGTPGVSGILGDLLRDCAPKPETQEVLASHGYERGAGLCSTFLAGKSFSWSCGSHKCFLSDDWRYDPLMAASIRLKRLWTAAVPVPYGIR
jgi:hypothetical protein